MDGARSFTGSSGVRGSPATFSPTACASSPRTGSSRGAPRASGRRQEYVLTDAGRDLFPVILTPAAVGGTPRLRPRRDPSTLVDRHGTPVPEVAPAAADGTLLDSRNTRVQKTR